MARGGARAGAGRKPTLDKETFLSMGARAHDLLAKRSHEEALVRLSKRNLILKAVEGHAAVEKKWGWPALRDEAIARQRQQLVERGGAPADLDELAAGTVVTRPPGMVREIAIETQKIFGTRKRGYREPLRRAYRARGAVLGLVVEEYRPRFGAKVTLRLVERALVDYRRFLALAQEKLAPPDPL